MTNPKQFNPLLTQNLTATAVLYHQDFSYSLRNPTNFRYMPSMRLASSTSSCSKALA